MISLFVTTASACVASLLFVGAAVADRRAEEMRYADDLALAIGGDYLCGYGLDMQAVRQAIDERLAALPAAARRDFRSRLGSITALKNMPDGQSCELRRRLAARMGLLLY